MRGMVVSCFCFMEQCAVMWAVWFAGGVVREWHGVSGKEWNPMRKTGRGLKERLLLPVLAVAVVAVPGCAGEKVTGNDGVITTTPAVEATSGVDVEKETEGQVTEPVEPVLPTGAQEASDSETQMEASQTLPEYATMDENINFYFKEKQGDLKIEWNLIPTPEETTEYYITMRIGEDFVTATVDLATYAGEELAFEKGWFKVPVEEKMQQSANEISGRAYEAVRSLLEKETGMTMGEVVR